MPHCLSAFEKREHEKDQFERNIRSKRSTAVLDRPIRSRRQLTRLPHQPDKDSDEQTTKLSCVLSKNQAGDLTISNPAATPTYYTHPPTTLTHYTKPLQTTIIDNSYIQFICTQSICRCYNNFTDLILVGMRNGKTQQSTGALIQQTHIESHLSTILTAYPVLTKSISDNLLHNIVSVLLYIYGSLEVGGNWSHFW